MANIIREVLTVQAMRLPLFTGGMSKVGIGISGTWTGTISFFASVDGINFNIPLAVQPYPQGTAVTSTAANGNFESPVLNYVAVEAVFTTRLTGSPVVVIGTSVDSSYQDAFLASTSKFVNQAVASGAVNIVTQAAQANRAWRLRTLVVAFSAAPAAAVKITIADGASATLWEVYATAAAGSQTIALPADPDCCGLSGGGVVNTPGNSLVITVAAPGGAVASEINAELIAA